MAGEKNNDKEAELNRCGKCELYTAVSEHHGRCEFWRSMDVRPEWMEGEAKPAHSVRADDGERCDGFIPPDNQLGSRHTWLLDNLTSRN
jgi:hypothetical protein